MTCLCGHPKADHQFALLVPGTCDLCTCPFYVEDTEISDELINDYAEAAHEPLAPHRLPIPASPTGAGQGPTGGAL